MERQYWIDGFNFFHHWNRTRDLFSRGADLDIARAIDLSLRALTRDLAGRAGHTVVFMDGGWRWEERRLGNLRVRYVGPGKKADDRMATDLRELDERARRITAVTNDRELSFRLSYLGASCLGVGEFLALIEKRGGGKGKQGKTAPRGGGEAEIMRQKCQTLSPAAVQAWLEFFGCGDDDS
ncbi:MAG: NYN domain-containing protein [Planctomycetota bacterium]|jgi:predicted RNA-binding protein with PIN domain|nr:NYN domain-containing protein [Planctomycetota bacterium]